MFVDEGFLVAILDTPSDRTSLARVSSDHARDVATLIAALRAAAPVPVWLVGTSMGTISAVSVASQLDTGGPDGIVLTSTVQQALNAGVDRVRVPTLVVGNLVLFSTLEGQTYAARVADGRVDAYFEQGTNLWDWAAGALVAAKAGAWVGGFDGGPASSDGIIAARPSLAAELRALLRKASARR